MDRSRTARVHVDANGWQAEPIVKLDFRDVQPPTFQRWFFLETRGTRLSCTGCTECKRHMKSIGQSDFCVQPLSYSTSYGGNSSFDGRIFNVVEQFSLRMLFEKYKNILWEDGNHKYNGLIASLRNKAEINNLALRSKAGGHPRGHGALSVETDTKAGWLSVDLPFSKCANALINRLKAIRRPSENLTVDCK